MVNKSKVIYVTLSQGEEQAFKMCLDDFRDGRTRQKVW